tara:strand:- start:1368 stop:2096 length:729 start_codon:yes stop_codon:yes gene_type:complete
MNYEKAKQILDLSHNFTKEDLRKKYREKCLQTHPDKNTNNNSNEFIEVKEAYNFLSLHLDTKNNQDYKNETATVNRKLFDQCIYFLNFLIQLFLRYVYRKYKIIILKPTLEDILNYNVYKLNINNIDYFIPLWIDCLNIKCENVIIKLEPPKNIKYQYEYINYDNSIYLKKNIEISFDDYKKINHINDNKNEESFLCNNINKKYIKNKGCSFIKPSYEYDLDYDILYKPVSKKSDIIINIET